MDAIERAIRSGFDKGDPDDRAFRERVYRSAYAALQKAILSNPNIDEPGAAKRRELFKQRVFEIEQEFVPAREDGEPAAEPLIATGDETFEAPQSSPSVETGFLGDVRPDTSRNGDAPAFGAPMLDEPRRPREDFSEEIREDRARVGGRTRRPRRQRPYAWAFIITTLVVAIGIGAWWGSSLLFGRQDGAVPNPAVQLEEEDFAPVDTLGAPPALSSETSDRAWISIFEPSDPTRVQTSSGSSAEMITRDGQQLMRISAREDGGSVSFDIGEGTLQRLAGRRAVFSIDASGEESGETQISIECDFGALGDCGRRRYIIGLERGEYLFELDMPQGAAGASGTISINPDITNAGRPLDVFGIRVAPAS